ncbi:MAG: M20 family metallopeptidase [Lawsonibacter sp.]|nr:M20 family metallopeptidase [Lawsonibacter sp.]
MNQINELDKRIIQLSDQFEQDVLTLRRAIHENPELSFQEVHTAALVQQALENIGLTVKCGIARTGLIADIHGSKPGRTLLLRADMDALPIQEQNDLPFRSKKDSVMHACGHDVHTANLVGVARILYELRDSWSGTIRLVFQPAEENGGGGREMIRAGILDDIPIDASIALHTMSTAEPGHFSLGWGNVTAYSDKFSIIVHGQKTHSAQPQDGVDAIAIAAQIITAINSILLKNIDPMDRATYSIGTIQGGVAPNVVPDQVEMCGMMRNITAQTREILREKISTTAEGIAHALGGSAEFLFTEGYSSVYNDPTLTDFVAKQIQDKSSFWLQGIESKPEAEEWLMREVRPILGAEDYGFYTQRVPSCFYRVATGDSAPAHSPHFLVQEPYIKLCTRSMSSLAINYLVKFSQI